MYTLCLLLFYTIWVLRGFKKPIYCRSLLLLASPIELTTFRMEALQARWCICASSLETFTQSFYRRVKPKTRDPERSSGSILRVVCQRDELHRYTSETEMALQFYHWYAISAPLVQNAVDAVIVEDHHHALFGYSYWYRLAAVEHNQAHRCLVDPVPCTQYCCAPRQKTGL